jgi:hypothetical protein
MCIEYMEGEVEGLTDKFSETHKRSGMIYYKIIAHGGYVNVI